MDFQMSRKREPIGLDELDSPPNNYIFSMRDTWFLIMGLVTYLFDLGLDCFTAYKHWHHGDMHWSYMTMGFMIVPSIIISIISFWWYYHDNIESEMEKKTSPLKWLIRSIFVVLQLAPIMRYIDCLIRGWKSRAYYMMKNRTQQEESYMETLYEMADCCFLRLFESFLEAIPQLVLQLYILCLVRSYEYSSNMIYLLWLSCLSSLVSIAWGMTAYSRVIRYVIMDKKNITWTGSLILLLWQCGTIGSRVVIFVIFSLIFGKWIFAVFVAHWIVMFIWLIVRTSTYKKIIPYDVFLYSILSIMYLFSFINDRDEKTRVKYIFYYCVCVVENIAMILLSVYLSHSTAWFLYSGIILHCALFAIGLAAMAVYYYMMHPSLTIPPDRNGSFHSETDVNRSSSSPVSQI